MLILKVHSSCQLWDVNVKMPGAGRVHHSLLQAGDSRSGCTPCSRAGTTSWTVQSKKAMQQQLKIPHPACDCIRSITAYWRRCEEHTSALLPRGWNTLASQFQRLRLHFCQFAAIFFLNQNFPPEHDCNSLQNTPIFLP